MSGQICQSCRQRAGLRKCCPICKRMVCSECWGKKHNSDYCMICERVPRISRQQILRDLKTLSNRGLL